MRWSLAVAACGASLGLGAGLVACIDLFHTTDDVLTACQLDGDIPDCGGDVQAEAARPVEAAPPEAGPTDFCNPGWSRAEAYQNAQRACAWLGACGSPLGGNAFGECMFQALLAYDCTANPSHPVRGRRRAAWDCVWQVKSCTDVTNCVFSGDQPSCKAPSGTACVGDVRLECLEAGTVGENCVLWGQTCGGDTNNDTFCAGAAGTAGSGCTNLTCDPATGRIHYCPGDGGPDIGIDCTSVGAGACVQEPPEAGKWIACAPTVAGDAGDAGCIPDASATCVNGVASSCPAGVPEQLDCARLLGDGGDPRMCTSGALNPSFDFTSPCYLDAGSTGGDAATPDAGSSTDVCAHQNAETCDDAGTITSRTRGVTYSLKCSDVGLRPSCALIETDNATNCRAQCGPPPP